jgi:hypothetical protein
VNTLYCLEEWRGKQRISPPGDNFTPREHFHPWGTKSPLGVKFAPRGEVKKGPQRPILNFPTSQLNFGQHFRTKTKKGSIIIAIIR